MVKLKLITNWSVTCEQNPEIGFGIYGKEFFAKYLATFLLLFCCCSCNFCCLAFFLHWTYVISHLLVALRYSEELGTPNFGFRVPTWVFSYLKTYWEMNWSQGQKCCPSIFLYFFHIWWFIKGKKDTSKKKLRKKFYTYPYTMRSIDPLQSCIQFMSR